MLKLCLAIAEELGRKLMVPRRSVAVAVVKGNPF
jgi:hypothetical protein